MTSVIVIGIGEEPRLEHGFFVIRLGDAERFELDLVIVAAEAGFESVGTVRDDEAGDVSDRIRGFGGVDGLGNGAVVHNEIPFSPAGVVVIVIEQTD